VDDHHPPALGGGGNLLIDNSLLTRHSRAMAGVARRGVQIGQRSALRFAGKSSVLIIEGIACRRPTGGVIN
jgi:hypothetical protein